ncbi:MAG: TonB-dependent receptor, partial [Candidatus Omnitrophota bacterium]|nr:TonB-dependent receptor [Candidatus Omnitrophota bacterium]
EESSRMNTVVVTATKAKTPKKEVTRAVSVVEGEGMGEKEGGFVADGLRLVPGTFVRRSGGFGRTTSLVIRGASATQVHVTVDGAHVASPTTGTFDFNHMAPDNLERVEILRGPNSVLYGADAMGGVVNFETRRGEGPFSGSYTQEAGNWSTWREAAEAQGQMGNWHLSGGISRLDTQGLSQNDEYQNTNISTRVGYDFEPDHTLDVTVRNILSIVGIDDGATLPDPNRVDRERQTIGSVRWNKPVASWWSQSVRLSTSIANLIDNDPSDRATNANALSKFDTERYGAEWIHRFTPVEWDTLTAGLEYEDREADNRRFSKAQNTRAGYLQNQWNPTEALTILTGGRWFRESSFGADTVLDGSAAYFFAPLGMKFRGGYAQGFRAPTLNELFFPNFGNPNLQAENSETIETGVEQIIFDDLLEWSATFFRTNYENLIQFVSVSGTTLPVNVGKARVDGVELETKLGPWNHWSLEGSYTHLDHGSRPSGEELLRVPNNTAGMGLRFAPGKWEARLDGLLISSREESVTGGRNKQEGYFKLDFYGKYQFKDWLRGFVRVENLTNRKYREILGFDAPGLTATAGITLEK